MMNDDDREAAKTQALISMGFGMMGAPNFWQGLARGGMFGLQAFQQANTATGQRRLLEAKLTEEEQQRQMRQIQIETAKRQQEEGLGIRAAATKAYAPGVTNLVPNDDEGNPLP